MFDYQRVIVDKPWVHGHQLGLHFFWQPKSNQSSFNLQYINMDDNNPYIMISYDLLNPKSRKNMWYFFRQSDWVFFFFSGHPGHPGRLDHGKASQQRVQGHFLCDARRFGIARLALFQDSAASGHWAMVWMLGGFYSTVYIYIYLSIYLYI